MSTKGKARGGTVWVIAASPEWDSEIGWLPPPDHVVVADGGTSIAVRLGLTPDLVVGDFDSCDPNALRQVERWRDEGVRVETFVHETKLETDTELAILAALEFEPERIYLLGATGGRLDHTLANILLLTHPTLAALDVRVVEGGQEIYLANQDAWNQIEGRPGDTVSLLPVGGDVTGVTLRDLKYPLHDATLGRGLGRGVSNVIGGSEPAVRFRTGLLLVVVLHETVVTAEGGSRS
jgi:thiamine pyrophosphokinase